MAKIDIYFLILGAIFFDFLIGDPTFLIHPVEIIGFLINKITNTFLKLFKNKNALVLSGLFTLIITVSFSYLTGRYIEKSYLSSNGNILWGIIVLISTASCLATKSLLSSVIEISNLVEEKFISAESKQKIIKKVQRLVSRNVSSFSKEELIRYSTESLTENSVDGVFGPLFWIFIGACFMKYSSNWPGPLSLGFSYKAISTLDSMIGYKYMPFKHFGLLSAKAEDYITFIPCRIVVFTLPLVSKKIYKYFNLIKQTFYEGSKYESPNSGLSEGIFAFVADIQLGGENSYHGKIISKPILNSNGLKSSGNVIKQICVLIIKLQFLWIILFSLIFFTI